MCVLYNAGFHFLTTCAIGVPNSICRSPPLLIPRAQPTYSATPPAFLSPTPPRPQASTTLLCSQASTPIYTPCLLCLNLSRRPGGAIHPCWPTLSCQRRCA